MANGIKTLQVRKARFDSTRMLDRNHWSKCLALKPEVFEAPHRKLFSSKTNSFDFSKGNILENVFGLGKTVYVDDLEWNWKMRVEGSKPMTILENQTPGDTPGANGQKIVLILDVDFGQIGETWTFGSSDKSQLVRITKISQNGGRGYRYEFETASEGRSHFIKPHYLAPGNVLSRSWTLRGEAAESGSFVENFTDISFKNRLVKLRKQYKVTDYAAQAVLDIRFMDNNGKIHSSWMDFQEAQYHMAMNRELANVAMYSRLTDKPFYDPDSGYPIKPGAGLQQQISFGGNNERYTTMSTELIEAFVAKMAYARVSPGDLGEIVGLTGYYGMQEFSKALDRWSGGKAIVRESTMFAGKDPKGVHNNSLQAGYQYTLYNLPNGGSFRLIYNPMNDDKSLHRDIDRLNGYPLESQRITVLDVTGGNGESLSTKDNIKLVRKNKVYATSIIEGRYGPGGYPSKDPKHAGDYYEVHISDSIGIQVTDPTVTGELIKVG